MDQANLARLRKVAVLLMHSFATRVGEDNGAKRAGRRSLRRLPIKRRLNALRSLGSRSGRRGR